MTRQVPRAALPLFWYAAITLGVPLSCGKGTNPHFEEHVTTVLGVVLAALAVIAITQRDPRGRHPHGGGSKNRQDAKSA